MGLIRAAGLRDPSGGPQAAAPQCSAWRAPSSSTVGFRRQLRRPTKLKRTQPAAAGDLA